jgi:hypothetical protein
MVVTIQHHSDVRALLNPQDVIVLAKLKLGKAPIGVFFAPWSNAVGRRKVPHGQHDGSYPWRLLPPR